MEDEELYDLLLEADEFGFITCHGCGNELEADSPQCYCGWENPLVKEGLI